MQIGSLAHTSLFAALATLVKLHGDEAAADLVGMLPDRIRSDEYNIKRFCNNLGNSATTGCTIWPSSDIKDSLRVAGRTKRKTFRNDSSFLILKADKALCRLQHSKSRYLTMRNVVLTALVVSLLAGCARGSAIRTSNNTTLIQALANPSCGGAGAVLAAQK
ncbi:MAG: hypothetical protein MO846_05250 [Candidatus Devosia symbiotica]|nr:hypothetical protein [Candidatus Devosia symbiotica]